MTATINNNSVSINMRDVLPALLRFNDRRELARYNGYTPTAFDTVQKYSDALNTTVNPLGGWNNTADNDLSPRGSWVLDSIAESGVGGIQPNNTGADVTPIVTVVFTVSEPLLLSPFIFSKPESNAQGFYGIQNMNFVFNIGDATRVWRYASPVAGVTNKTVSLTEFSSDSQLIFNFLTPHPSDLLASRNCVPYYEVPRYLSSVSPASWNAGTNATLNTQNIQLNQIPDKLVLFVRKPLNQVTNSDPDFFYPIKKISLNFNNQSGILASATTQDLYRYSVENTSNQSWYEFSGKATLATSGSGSGTVISTSGSMLVLEFGKDIQLTEDFYAPGSLGNFNLQCQLEVQNNTSAQVTSAEIVLITINSGVFVCEKGTSTTYTGILTKADVLEASSQEPYTRSDVVRLVGGGFLDTLKSVAGKVIPKLPSVAKSVLQHVDNPYAKAGSDVLGALGYAKPKGKLSSRLM